MWFVQCHVVSTYRGSGTAYGRVQLQKEGGLNSGEFNLLSVLTVTYKKEGYIRMAFLSLLSSLLLGTFLISCYPFCFEVAPSACWISTTSCSAELNLMPRIG